MKLPNLVGKFSGLNLWIYIILNLEISNFRTNLKEIIIDVVLLLLSFGSLAIS